MSGRSFNLTILFLGRLRPPKRLTSTWCAYFLQYLTTALLESAEGETKVCGQTGYQTYESGALPTALCDPALVTDTLKLGARVLTDAYMINLKLYKFI